MLADASAGYLSERVPLAEWFAPVSDAHKPLTTVHLASVPVSKSKAASPTFRDALETQYVCDAVLKSAKTCRWEKVTSS